MTKKKKQQDNALAKKIGILITMGQVVASCIFMVIILMLNMVPSKLLLLLTGVLLILVLIPLATQLLSKKKGIAGKVFSGVMIVVLLAGSFYTAKANGALGIISGGDYKLDNIVVAVLAEDKAKVLEDAKDYQFGVQYSMGGSDIKSGVAAINEELGSEVTIKEYKDLSEQAAALHDGKVEAIVYNEGYAGILEEAFEGFSENVKIIYTHQIKKEVDNKSADISVKSDTFSVFLSGIDVYGPIATNSRSDVNIIATINPTTHQVLLVTTPRDYYVQIPEVTGSAKDKLTHAGIYGVDASMRTLGSLYDMNIDFYARVNFTSLIEIVDTLGGIQVESELAFTTSADAGVVMNVKKGINTFNGKQALAFSRERQNIAGGDNQRGKNQQAVITAIIRKMMSPAILINANGIINSVSGNVETNMSQEQIQELVKSQLNKGGSWNIKSMAAEGTEDSQYCFSYSGKALYVTQPDMASVEAIKAAVNAVENGEILSDSQIAE